MKLSRLAPLVLVVVSISLSNCSSQRAEASAKAPEGGVLLKGAGSTFLSPLCNRWFKEYQQQHPTTVISYAAVGSGEGIQRFLGADVDFGASDFALTDAQLAKAPQGAVLLPVTGGAIVLAYNLPGVSADLRLSREAYAGIFLGDIKEWNDPRITKTNPGVKLPHLAVASVVRQDSSGTTFAFTKHLDAISPKWRDHYSPAEYIQWPGGPIHAKGNEGVAGVIKKSVGSIGYVGLEFATRLNLKTAVLENKRGNFVKVSDQACQAALDSANFPDNLRVFVPDPSDPNAYPIVTFSWILLSSNYANVRTADALKDLFGWCLRDGQNFAPGLGYVHLPPRAAQKALLALDTVGAEK